MGLKSRPCRTALYLPEAHSPLNVLKYWNVNHELAICVNRWLETNSETSRGLAAWEIMTT
ncbi:hypothetical protein [Nostoc sp.]|uniref:hypothetical protein n=1 Tax=Nostoc sp. TaxID=1180 RepID=UPI002FFB2B72